MEFSVEYSITKIFDSYSPTSQPPYPPDESQPNSMVLPPPYFTVDMLLFFSFLGSVRSVAHNFKF